MIEVSQLTKRYARHEAVRDISFSVARGEIVGFLGPNGAGKTTTLRMLTGYLPPTSGTATIANFDIYRQSIEARRKIGYMPENVPIYEDMRVREYLRFRAQLKGLSSSGMRRRVGEVIDTCGLENVRRKMIKTLSKGFGALAAEGDGAQIELRASWSPEGAIAAHVEAWAELVCMLAGLPPGSEGIAMLGSHRSPRG